MEQTKKLTPEQAAQNDAAKKALKMIREQRVKQKEEAFTVLKSFCEKDPIAKAALTSIRPSLYGTVIRNSKGQSFIDKFVALITARKSIAEEEVFKELKMGRKECGLAMKLNFRKNEPANWVWINFNPDSGMYKLVGKGETEPSGYTGPKPASAEIILK